MPPGDEIMKKNRTGQGDLFPAISKAKTAGVSGRVITAGTPVNIEKYGQRPKMKNFLSKV